MPEHLSVDRTTMRRLPASALPRAAYQGVAGAFGEEAVHQLWDGGAHACPAPTFDAALEALVRGEVEWAVIPIWNSTIGPIAPACAALDARGRTIVRVREVGVRVRHCLLGRPGTAFADVRHVGSHPAALAQCTRLFQENPTLVACEAFDTAGAARELSAFGEPAPATHRTWYAAMGPGSPARLAAIASARAAEEYGLVVLRRDVNDDPANVTRFVSVRASGVTR